MSNGIDTAKRFKQPENVEDTHTRHCCGEHNRCKYGEEESCTAIWLYKKNKGNPVLRCNCEWD